LLLLLFVVVIVVAETTTATYTTPIGSLLPSAFSLPEGVHDRHLKIPPPMLLAGIQRKFQHSPTVSFAQSKVQTVPRAPAFPP